MKRDEVVTVFKHFDYNSTAFPPVEPYILESSVNSQLWHSNIYFNGPALEGVRRELIIDPGNSPFFRGVVERNADLINAAWVEQQDREAASLERTQFHHEIRELGERVRQLRHERAHLITRIQYNQDRFRQRHR